MTAEQDCLTVCPRLSQDSSLHLLNLLEANQEACVNVVVLLACVHVVVLLACVHVIVLLVPLSQHHV